MRGMKKVKGVGEERWKVKGERRDEGDERRGRRTGEGRYPGGEKREVGGRERREGRLGKDEVKQECLGEARNSR